MNVFIDWDSLEFKKSSGKEKIRCPECDSRRTDKKDKSLMINHGEGYGKCFYCEALTFRNDKEDENLLTKEYKLPRQDWKNYTTLSDSMVKYLESRKISQHTAIALGLTEEKYYQPSKGKEVNNLVFNYFEGEKLVNKKYRSADKKFTQSAGTKSIFYNINSILGDLTAFIVEGEVDVLSMHESGYKSVISVPNGANDNDDYWKNSEKYLKNIKTFVIGVDNDEKGNELKEKIAQRLGRYRCEFIEWDGKDANEDLISGKIHESVKNRKKFPVSGTFKASDLLDGVLDLYDNGLPKTIYPKHPRFGNLKNIFSVMRGQLVVATGIRSHGKSTFTDDYVINLLNDYDLKGSWFSPEHSPMPLYKTNFIQKVTGKNFWGKYRGEQVPRVTKEEINQYVEWAEERIYLTDCDNGEFPTWEWLINKFKEQMYSYGVDIFVIDAFNKVVLPNGNKKDEIDKVLTKLTAFCQQNHVIIFLVAHPTKLGRDDNGLYRVPTLTDVSGSGDFENQTHCGYTIYRYWEDLETNQQDETVFINMKTKFSFQGKMTEKEIFKYCGINDRYYVPSYGPPTYNMISGEKQELPKIEVEDAFDEEIPF